VILLIPCDHDVPRRQVSRIGGTPSPAVGTDVSPQETTPIG
jgi:hypothetical protein